MSQRFLRAAALVDVMGVPLLIFRHIWRLQFTARNA